MGVLRITCNGKKSKFLYKCKKHEVARQIASHLAMFSREKVDGKAVTIPTDAFTAEWQETDNWVDGNPAEKIPVLPIRS